MHTHILSEVSRKSAPSNLREMKSLMKKFLTRERPRQKVANDRLPDTELSVTQAVYLDFGKLTEINIQS